MAHTCETYHDYKLNKDLYIIRADARDIKLVSLVDSSHPQGQILKNTKYYGMNASWIALYEDSGVTYAGLCNIAYQDGKALGYEDTGTYARVGDCLIYYKNNQVNYAEGVENGNDARVPKGIGTWAQSGLGLYFGYSKWVEKYRDQPQDEDYTVGKAARAAMVIDKDTNKVYLIACFDSVLLSDFRASMMSYFGLEDSQTYARWKAILLDGGISAQIRGNGMQKQGVLTRSVPQIISVGQV